MAQVIKHLPNKWEALTSHPSTTKNNNKKDLQGYHNLVITCVPDFTMSQSRTKLSSHQSFLKIIPTSFPCLRIKGA
jgi:hypothetical protein